MANDLRDQTDDSGQNRAGHSAKETFDEMRDDLSEKVSELAGEARDALEDKAEDAKQGLGGSLKALGEAMRAASDNLSENGQAGTSKVIGDAASGLERFADALQNRPLGEVLDEVRAFGRVNSGGLFATSMLAGLALGRLFRAGESTGTPSSGTSSGSGEGSGWTGSDGDSEQAPVEPSPPPTATSGYAI